MITVTPSAQERLGAFLTQNNASRRVRVFLPSAGCGGEGQLALTVDEPKADDFSVSFGDVVYCISKELQSVTGSVTIDFKDDGGNSGFVVDPEKILPPMDSDCGGGCCGCG
jgi:Fe-S cluster assembly iron-binding protein IscA